MIPHSFSFISGISFSQSSGAHFKGEPHFFFPKKIYLSQETFRYLKHLLLQMLEILLTDNTEHIIEFTLIFNRFKKKLYNYVLKMTEDIMLTEDIVQDIFVKLYQNLDNIRSKENINFWLFTTARNEVYGYYRKKRIRSDQFGVEDPDEIEIESEESIENEFEKKEMKELILFELNNLPVEQREVFILKEYSGLKYTEIGDVLGIDEKLVKSRLNKVRNKLINKISKLIV